jgi:hypothetical protein
MLHRILHFIVAYSGVRKLLFIVNVTLAPVHNRKAYGCKAIAPLVINFSPGEGKDVTLDFQPLCTRTRSIYVPFASPVWTIWKGDKSLALPGIELLLGRQSSRLVTIRTALTTLCGLPLKVSHKLGPHSIRLKTREVMRSDTLYTLMVGRGRRCYVVKITK